MMWLLVVTQLEKCGSWSLTDWLAIPDILYWTLGKNHWA